MSSLYLPKVIAHRGASGYAPENTLTAIQHAFALDAEWVEFDVKLAKCGEIILFHDDTLQRTTNGKGKVADFSYAQLRQLDAGSWFSPLFNNEHIPTLSEVLNYLKLHKMQVNIELKPSPGQAMYLANQVSEVLLATWPAELPLIVSSFDLESLFAIRNLSSTLPLGLLLSHWRDDWEFIAEEIKCVSIHANQKMLTPARINTFKQSRRLVLAYTVNDPNHATSLWSWGVDAVFSDFPDKILTAAKKYTTSSK